MNDEPIRAASSINLAPSWRGMSRFFLAVLSGEADATETARRFAREELDRMAQLADLYVAEHNPKPANDPKPEPLPQLTASPHANSRAGWLAAAREIADAMDGTHTGIPLTIYDPPVSELVAAFNFRALAAFLAQLAPPGSPVAQLAAADALTAMRREAVAQPDPNKVELHHHEPDEGWDWGLMLGTDHRRGWTLEGSMENEEATFAITPAGHDALAHVTLTNGPGDYPDTALSITIEADGATWDAKTRTLRLPMT
jgi:hypothetical protein